MFQYISFQRWKSYFPNIQYIYWQEDHSSSTCNIFWIYFVLEKDIIFLAYEIYFIYIMNKKHTKIKTTSVLRIISCCYHVDRRTHITMVCNSSGVPGTFYISEEFRKPGQFVSISQSFNISLLPWNCLNNRSCHTMDNVNFAYKWNLLNGWFV